MEKNNKMETIKSEHFTYGFELEGTFKNDFIDSLYENSKKYDIELKGDGSVHERDLCQDNVAYFGTGDYDSEDNEVEDLATEVNVGVFSSFKDFMGVLSQFRNEKNYFQNDSCGLHIHIKPKTAYSYLRGMAFDKKFIAKIQEYAGSMLCEHTIKRVANNQYCRTRGTFGQMLSAYQSREKYSFMGNHPSGTIEFRFFSPCTHKESNATKFFQFFFRELNQVERELKKGFMLEIPQSKTLDFTEYLGKSKELAEQVKVSSKIQKINIKIGVCA